MNYKYFLFIFVYFLFSNSLFSQQNSQNTRPKVGLVLSGGGAKGFAHIGVIKVLEEAGIPIDFIGGTSMGSIVGAMYAIGYDAITIEKIVLEQNWDELLSDKIPRSILSIQEKEQDSKFFFSFPIRNRKVQLPEGIMSGYQIYKMLSRFAIPVRLQRDFNKFSTPFLCVASDIETGKSVTLSNGYLPDALRASMSIPSAFMPFEINNKLLVDGGLVNNLPVEEVKLMGADIIIAVDVQDPFYTKEELNSITRILQQAGKFLRAPSNIKNRQMTDILINPDIKKFSVSSFRHADSIIASGETATRLLLPDILKLTGVSSPTKKISVIPNAKTDSVQIDFINILDLHHVSMGLAYGKLNITTPQKISYATIEESIDRLFGSQYFEQVRYRIDSLAEGNILIVTVKEKTTNMFRVGLHYDTDQDAAILLNTTFRNIYKNGSTLWFEARLSQSPRFAASFFVDKGWKPGLSLDFQINNMEVVQDSAEINIASYNYSEMYLNCGFQSFLFSSFGFGAGVQGEMSSIRNKISPIALDKVDYRFLNYYGFLKMDTYDRTVYPRKGIQFFAEGKIITEKGDYKEIDSIRPNIFLSARFNMAWKWNEKLSLITQIYGGTVLGKNIPLPYSFYLGGVSNHVWKGIFPFIGLNRMEVTGTSCLVARLDAQYELFNDNFITLKLNTGKATTAQYNLLNTDNLLTGYGLSYGYNSLVGPIELTIMSSNDRKKVMFYLNLGFWF